jgi:hypothetical protein
MLMARSGFFIGFSLEWSSCNDRPNAKVVAQIDVLFKLPAKTLLHDFDPGNPSSVAIIFRIYKDQRLQNVGCKGCKM